MSAQLATAKKSMEDILASIRHTIEHDVETKKRRAVMPENNKTQPENEDVFELTQMVNDDGSVSQLDSQASIQNDANEDQADFKSMETDAPSDLIVQASLDETVQTADETLDPLMLSDDDFVTEESVAEAEANGPHSEVSSAQLVSESPQDLKDNAVDVAAIKNNNNNEESGDHAMNKSNTEHAEATPDTADQSQTSESDEAHKAWMASGDHTALISETVAQEASQALSDLSAAVAPNDQAAYPEGNISPRPTSETIGQSTVEGLMRELLRPMLKDWLDAHLPSLVKWIVTEQIEKIIQEKKNAL